ncbi:MAG: GNAT family N-acetyltransferase [Gracilibacteraceae bacterium]|jgi:phosphinothricin acetyltransferase|nr:GNAT family N-acetyltransferase [Gracilibacteraceae bacterium]
METLKFRNALVTDLPIIVAIYNSTIASGLVTADTETVSPESRRPWFDEHNARERPLWLVENEAKPVGWVSFRSFYGRPAYAATAEISLYLAPEQRGRGFGGRIMRYCLDNAPLLGIKTLLAFIFAHNEPSLKLFRRFGFADWGTLPAVAEINGREYGLKILGKRIA